MRTTKAVSIKESLLEQHEVDMQLVLSANPMFGGNESLAFLAAIARWADEIRGK